jgi:alpha-2-macroglobulin
VPIAPELSVTFSSPMVAVTSQDDAAKTTPVKLTPTPKGRWRWIGTRTVLFDPEIRFPMATTYTVEVPAGTKATNGNALKKATTFTFETPTVTLTGRYPYEGQPQHVDVPMFLMFDQKIDPQAVLAKIKITANGKTFQTKLLSDAEVAQDKDKQLAAMIESAKKNEQDGRWLAFRATQPFPADAQVTIEIGAGTPSAEGPNKTAAAQTCADSFFAGASFARSYAGGPCLPSLTRRFMPSGASSSLISARSAIGEALPGFAEGGGPLLLPHDIASADSVVHATAFENLDRFI